MSTLTEDSLVKAVESLFNIRDDFNFSVKEGTGKDQAWKQAVEDNEDELQELTATFGDCSVCDQIKNGCSVEDAVRTADKVSNLVRYFRNQFELRKDLSDIRIGALLAQKHGSEKEEDKPLVQLAFDKAKAEEEERRAKRQKNYEKIFEEILDSMAKDESKLRKLKRLNERQDAFIKTRDPEEVINGLYEDEDEDANARKEQLKQSNAHHWFERQAPVAAVHKIAADTTHLSVEELLCPDSIASMPVKGDKMFWMTSVQTGLKEENERRKLLGERPLTMAEFEPRFAQVEEKNKQKLEESAAKVTERKTVFYDDIILPIYYSVGPAASIKKMKENFAIYDRLFQATHDYGSDITNNETALFYHQLFSPVEVKVIPQWEEGVPTKQIWQVVQYASKNDGSVFKSFNSLDRPALTKQMQYINEAWAQTKVDLKDGTLATSDLAELPVAQGTYERTQKNPSITDMLRAWYLQQAYVENSTDLWSSNVDLDADSYLGKFDADDNDVESLKNELLSSIENNTLQVTLKSISAAVEQMKEVMQHTPENSQDYDAVKQTVEKFTSQKPEIEALLQTDEAAAKDKILSLVDPLVKGYLASEKLKEDEEDSDADEDDAVDEVDADEVDEVDEGEDDEVDEINKVSDNLLNADLGMPQLNQEGQDLPGFADVNVLQDMQLADEDEDEDEEDEEVTVANIKQQLDKMPLQQRWDKIVARANAWNQALKNMEGTVLGKLMNVSFKMKDSWDPEAILVRFNDHRQNQFSENMRSDKTEKEVYKTLEHNFETAPVMIAAADRFDKEAYKMQPIADAVARTQKRWAEIKQEVDSLMQQADSRATNKAEDLLREMKDKFQAKSDSGAFTTALFRQNIDHRLKTGIFHTLDGKTYEDNLRDADKMLDEAAQLLAGYRDKFNGLGADANLGGGCGNFAPCLRRSLVRMLMNSPGISMNDCMDRTCAGSFCPSLSRSDRHVLNTTALSSGGRKLLRDQIRAMYPLLR